MEKIIKNITEWSYLKELPTTILSFNLKLLMKQDGDLFYICAYQNFELKKEVVFVYDHATKEFLVKLKIGLLDYCETLFISTNLERYERILKEKLENVIRDLTFFSKDKIDSILFDKNIMQHKFNFEFPEKSNGFKLYIRPNQPLKLINGSYVILDYSDFANDSNLVIYYNIFRDEFFGELRIRKTPEMTSAFDAKEVSELAEKIEENLVDELKKLRARIEEKNE